MRKTLSMLLLIVALFAVAPVAFAQTATYQTVTTAAINATTQTIPVLATTSMTASSQSVNSFMFCDGEAMKIQAFNSTSLTVTVTRGQLVTNASAHGSGVPCFYGVQGGTSQTQLFVTQIKNGFGGNGTSAPTTGSVCTRTDYQFLPLVNVQNNSLIDCVATRSTATSVTDYRWRSTSLAMFTGAHPLTSITNAAGTVTLADEFVRLGVATAGRTFTLPAVSGITGKVMVIKHDAENYTLTVSTSANQFITTVGTTSTGIGPGSVLRLVSVQASSGAWGWATW